MVDVHGPALARADWLADQPGDRLAAGTLVARSAATSANSSR